MNKPVRFNFELIEFYILGFLVFSLLFSVFIVRLRIPYDIYLQKKNTVSMPMKGMKTIAGLPSVVSNTPDMVIVNDNDTPCTLEDDIINFNTHFYSLLLPYNLSHFTDQYGANNSSRHLVYSMNLLQDQVFKQHLVEDPMHQESFNLMILRLNQMVEHEDKIYTFIIESQKNEATNNMGEILESLKEIDTDDGKLPLLISRRQQEVVYALQETNAPSAYEAIIIIDTLNNHMYILADRTRADFYRIVENKGFDYSKFNKPVIYNIINRLNSALKTKADFPVK
jgi:hypothetical protein